MPSDPVNSKMNTIPVELLREILIAAAYNDPPRVDDISLAIHIGWLVTTHVSHLWRETGLATKSAWTNILLNLGVEWVRVMLERAGPTLPLSITLADCQELNGIIISSEALNLVFPNEMHRVKRLEMWANSVTLEWMYEKLEGVPAPLLESLHLAKTEQWASEDTVFEGIFAGKTPRLSFLHLDGVSIPQWDSFYLFKNLKYIHIYSYGNPIGAPPSDILTALSHMSKLEKLSIGGCVLYDCPIESDDVTALAREERPKVNLAWLRTLTIEGPKHIVDYMMKHIMFPESCIVNTKEIGDE